MRFRKLKESMNGVTTCGYIDYVIRKLGHTAENKGSNGSADIRPDRFDIRINDNEDLRILQELYCVEAGDAWMPAGIVSKYRILKKAVKSFLKKKSSFNELKRLVEELEQTDK